MVEPKKLSIVKPTPETPFHIDFDWWRENDREWRVHLRSLLSAARGDHVLSKTRGFSERTDCIGGSGIPLAAQERQHTDDSY